MVKKYLSKVGETQHYSKVNYVISNTLQKQIFQLRYC